MENTTPWRVFLEKYFAKVDETNNLSENIKVYKYRIGGGSNYDKDHEKGTRRINGEGLLPFKIETCMIKKTYTMMTTKYLQ